MNTYYIGEIIRQKRIEKGLTQEVLSEGICEHSTLSRIETGRQTPSKTVLNCLLEKLDLPSERYYAFVDEHDMEIENLKTEITACTVTSKHEQGLKELAKLEKLVDKNDNINNQFILRAKALLGKIEDNHVVPYTNEEELNLLLQAIRLTVPRFDIEEINSCLYCIEEIKIINQIAITYERKGKRRTAIEIWHQLIKYIKKNYHLAIQNKSVMALVSYNYSRSLYLEKRYEEALEIAELGKHAAIDYGQYRHLPGIYSVMAEIYYELGNYDLSKEKYYESYYIFKGTGNIKQANIVKADAKKNLNIDFD